MAAPLVHQCDPFQRLQRLMNQSFAGYTLEQMLDAGPGCDCACDTDED